MEKPKNRANAVYLRSSDFLQLEWLYKQSLLYEKAHLRFSVFRVFDEVF